MEPKTFYSKDITIRTKDCYDNVEFVNEKNMRHGSKIAKRRAKA